MKCCVAASGTFPAASRQVSLTVTETSPAAKEPVNVNLNVLVVPTRATPVTVILDLLANDGAAGEGDWVGAGTTDVESIMGGAGNDILTGSSVGNYISGGAGIDLIHGMDGSDTLVGGAGSDSIYGDNDADFIFAKDGEFDLIDGGPGIDAIGQFFVVLGFSARRRHALMAGLAETGGGLFLALGFLTPAAAAVLFSVMLVAALSVHVKKGFFITSGGYEYALVLGVAALTFAFTGPGSLSVDALVGYSVNGAPCGVAALIGGVLGAVIALTQRGSIDATNPTAG